MKICKQCGNEFSSRMIIDGKKRNLANRKFCLQCAPFGMHHSTRERLQRESALTSQPPQSFCRYCNALLPYGRKYCNSKCQQQYQYEQYITRWKAGLVSGNKGSWGGISNYVRRYILEKYNYKCTVCGWSQINPYTQTLPLEVEHIDGDCTHTYEENLTVLCPNCHSLTPTYRGANRGHGKRNITWIPKNKT